MKAKRRLKTIGREETSNEITKTRRRLLTKHINEEHQKSRMEKIKNTIEQLRGNGGGMKEETFWEFRRKLKGKQEERAVAMKDGNGNKQEDQKEILKIFEQYYENLFRKDIPTTEEEKKNEKRVEVKLEDIIKEGQKQEPLLYTEKEIKKIINTLKRKKAQDSMGWKNEMIMDGGEEMVKSITIMFNRLSKENKTPRQWENMEIKSIFKNKGSKMDVKNRRGIFLTSVLSKLYEKAIMERTQNEVKTSSYQNGGKKGRSTKDNWMAIMAVMDEYKRWGNDLYVLFADAEKCFDRLWLKDCLVDLHTAGMREREVETIYNMNRKAKMVIDTPHGKTRSIQQEEIVKQGTVYGPQLCCVSTDQVNEIGGRPVTIVAPTMKI